MSYVTKLKGIFYNLFKLRKRSMNRREWALLVNKTRILLGSQEKEKVSAEIIKVLENPANSMVFHSPAPREIMNAQLKVLNLILATKNTGLICRAGKAATENPSLYGNKEIVSKLAPYLKEFPELTNKLKLKHLQLELPLKFQKRKKVPQQRKPLKRKPKPLKRKPI
jgi:hypothetical protein